MNNNIIALVSVFVGAICGGIVAHSWEFFFTMFFGAFLQFIMTNNSID